MRWALALIPVFVAVVSTGCLPSVTADQLPGNWAIGEESRDRLPDESQKGAGQIVFQADGTFSATEMPQEMLYGEGEHLLTGRGSWTLDDKGTEVRLSFASIEKGNLSAVPWSPMPALAASTQS